MGLTVKELRESLNNYPDDMEVIVDMHSDYALLATDGLEITKAVQQGWGIMCSHRTMSEENKSKEKDYLYLGGG